MESQLLFIHKYYTYSAATVVVLLAGGANVDLSDDTDGIIDSTALELAAKPSHVDAIIVLHV